MSLFSGRAWARSLPITVLLLSAAAQAAPLHLAAAGTKLAIEGSCAQSVSIEPDAALTGHVVVDATADHPEEMAHLALTSLGDGTAKLHQTIDRCFRVDGVITDEPTLHITVHVPAGTPIALEEGGGVNYSIGAVGGPLALDLSGGVQLHAAHATALNLDLSGGGQLAIAQIDGAIDGQVSGGGRVNIDHTTAPALSLEVSGGGFFHVADGTIAKVKIELSGGGHVQVGGTVGDASVDVSGGGSVEFAHVTGQLEKDVSGSGSVTVAGQ